MNVMEALTHTTQPRGRIMDDQMMIKLPKEAKALLKKAADAQGLDLSVVTRLAIAEYLTRRGYLKP